jgi:hypothetical protein
MRLIGCIFSKADHEAQLMKRDEGKHERQDREGNSYPAENVNHRHTVAHPIRLPDEASNFNATNNKRTIY